MISIGNDIVALDRTNTRRTLEKRFYSKILCEEEVYLFNNNAFELNFEYFIWLAWSIKESVYKFVKRHSHQAAFSPTKIVVKTIVEPQQQTKINLEKNEGISFNTAECICCGVLYNNAFYYTRCIINNHFIFTVANDTDCFKKIYWGIQNGNGDSSHFQSTLVRSFALERLKQQLRTENLHIEKTTSGIPFIVPHINIPLSFTHHGNYVGYSFLLEDIH